MNRKRRITTDKVIENIVLVFVTVGFFVAVTSISWFFLVEVAKNG